MPSQNKCDSRYLAAFVMPSGAYIMIPFRRCTISIRHSTNELLIFTLKWLITLFSCFSSFLLLQFVRFCSELLLFVKEFLIVHFILEITGSTAIRCPVGEVPGRGRVRNCQAACPNEPHHACSFVIDKSYFSVKLAKN